MAYCINKQTLLLACKSKQHSKFHNYFNENKTQNRGKILPKIEEIIIAKAHANTQKLNQNILMITAVFLNQQRVNVCEHTTKMASLESF